MLFNKNNIGAEEIKDLIGFIYASNEFENLLTYIRLAEREVKPFISKEVFDFAQAHYDSADYNIPGETDPDNIQKNKLVQYIQLPVALLAYKKYAPSSDITHSDKGRQIFVSENEKPAFEWMIDKDNANLLSLYHESMDMLLEFLDEQKDIDPLGAVYTATQAYVQSRSLLINSAKEFSEIFPINESRRLYLVLQPFIREAEKDIIMPCLKATEYDILKELIKDGDLNEPGNEYYKAIAELAKVPLALYTMSIASKRLSIEVLPDGVFQNFITSQINQSKLAGENEKINISQLLETEAMKKIKRLQEYIRKHNMEAAGETYEPEDLTERMDPDNKFFRF